MQSIAQGVLAWELTESSQYLGLIVFAGLVPLGLLSLVGGSLADTADRRKLLLGTQIWQMLGSLTLAALVIDDEIAPGLLLVVVFITALGQGIYAPTFGSVVPSLAGTENIGAAISLNSSQIQAARVVGPAIGGWLTSQVGFAEVFAINALTYLAVIFAVYITEFPESAGRVRSLSDRLLGGLRLASRFKQVGRPLLAMFLFAFFCLPFIGQLPAYAELRLGIDAVSSSYGWFYACFGLGAFSGAFMVGTFFRATHRPTVARIALVGFGASQAFLAAVTSLFVAYFAVFLVGLFYFMFPVTMATMWQEHVTDAVRGRIAAIWVLSFGGTVPFSNLAAGFIVERTSLQTIMFASAIAALILAIGVRFPRGPVIGDEDLDGLTFNFPGKRFRGRRWLAGNQN